MISRATDMDASGSMIPPPPLTTAYSITNISVFSPDADKKTVSIIFPDNATWFQSIPDGDWHFPILLKRIKHFFWKQWICRTRPGIGFPQAKRKLS
jgi:hypothetical protein